MTQLELIAKAERCTVEDVPLLTALYAGHNPGITDAGLAHVPLLTTLYAGGNSGITDAMVATLRARGARVYR